MYLCRYISCSSHGVPRLVSSQLGTRVLLLSRDSGYNRQMGSTDGSQETIRDWPAWQHGRDGKSWETDQCTAGTMGNHPQAHRTRWALESRSASPSAKTRHTVAKPADIVCFGSMELEPRTGGK